MKLFHTSPNEITKINKFGNFFDCLFFSTGIYEMSACKTITYSIDASEMDFAESLLDSSKSVWDYEFGDAESDWYIQAQRGLCAKEMGFDGCKDIDEQGIVYIIPMHGRESILTKEK